METIDGFRSGDSQAHTTMPDAYRRARPRYVRTVKRPVRAPREQFDLVVIGMGSAGTLAVELAAHDLGLRVAAVERSRIGGDCLWTGCVPSKALLASARVAHTVRHASLFGVDAGVDAGTGPRIDLDGVWRRIKTVQAEIAATDDSPDRFRAMGAELVIGEARVTGPREVTVATADGERVLRTRFVLVCTGSRAAVPPIVGIDTVPVLTSDHLFEIERPPDSVVVLGGGPIAVELGQALHRLGVTTTLVERETRLLPREEPELADRLATVLRREGVDLRLGISAARVGVTDGGVEVELADGTVEHAAGLLVATGRVANVDALGLEALGLAVAPDGVHVDGRSRTHVPTIYAVGDAAAGRPRFTHTAAYDAAAAIRDMFFPGRGLAPAVVPWCTFSDPELARVGLTADEARAVHGDRAVTVHRHELHHVDRARADGATDGLLLVVAVRRRIVGAHLLAPGAGELVHELALAMKAGIGLDELARLVHVYPTIATGVGRLAGDHAIGRARKLRGLAKLGRWLG